MPSAHTIGRPSLWLAVVAIASAVATALSRRELPSQPVPIIGGTTEGGYVTSRRCRSCHPREHHTWQASYHRSMTQTASEASVLAPWRPSTYPFEGTRIELFRRGPEYWVKLPDPDRMAELRHEPARWAELPRVERQVLLTTGSHHYQAYWLQGARGNELWQLPLVFHRESQRFLPRRAAFLQPPDDPPHLARWNSNCIQCHSVAGRPSHDPRSDRFESRVAELGVACEACHGPGAEHVARHANPWERRQARLDDAPDPSIVNPAQLTAARSAEVCGQCHSFFVPRDADQWWTSGFSESYRPGEKLADSRRVLDHRRDQREGIVSADLDSIFHADGSVRVGGRELNGLYRSPCFERGRGDRQMSCLSCHQLHGGSKNDQLKAEGSVDAPCKNCHATLADAGSAHTHHAPDSPGSACVNCHMPRTTYALLQGIRSHRISSPNANADRALATPNACNLCHLDQGLRWTAQWLSNWYDQMELNRREPPRKTTPGPLEPTARLGWSMTGTDLLAGDAAARVIAAHALGQRSARITADRYFAAQLLAEAIGDPYAAVRFVAARSLRRQPGFGDWTFDFVGKAPARREAQQRARRLARSLSESPIDPSLLEQLVRERDSTPVRISE